MGRETAMRRTDDAQSVFGFGENKQGNREGGMCKVRAIRKSILISALACLAGLAGTMSSFGQQLPVGCTPGSSINQQIFCDSLGLSPIGTGTLLPGQTVFYQASLNPGGQCAVSGGVFRVVTPDGVSHDATPAGGIPLVCNDAAGTP